MKLINLILVVLMLNACDMKNEVESDSRSETIISPFDSLLAAETGADPYGMRKYVLALLKVGPNRNQDSTEAARLQRAHLDNISRLAEAGVLVLAGPFLDDGEVRGIYLFAVETVEETKRLTETDPSVKAGRLVMELHPWYGSAALMKINELHNKIAKENI